MTAAILWSSPVLPFRRRTLHALLAVYGRNTVVQGLPSARSLNPAQGEEEPPPPTVGSTRAAPTEALYGSLPE
jgi:hypothetical protein